jgi:hypothetical protein
VIDLTVTAVVVAARASPGGGEDDGPGLAALLPYEDGTLLSHLLEQLDRLGASAHHLFVPGDAHDALARHVEGVDLHAYDDEAGLFHALAEVAGSVGDEPLVVLSGDVLTHADALADLVADARVSTAVLARGCPDGAGPDGMRVQAGRVVSAGSSRHRVSGATWDAPVALRVAAADRPALVEAATRAADTTPARSRPAPARGPDVVGLLTVALVRDGGAVGAVALDGRSWLRPRSRADVAAAPEALARDDVAGRRLRAAVKERDGFVATFLVSPWSRHVARWAAQRGLTPNVVTLVSLLVGLGAAAAVATGERWGYVTGAVLLMASFALDCVDGQVARYARTFTALGGWLDATLDRVKEYAVYAALAVGASRTGDDVWLLAVAALALLTFRHTVDLGYEVVTRPVPPAPVRLPYGQHDDVPADPEAPADADGTDAGTDAGVDPGDGARPARRSPARALVVSLASLDRWRWTVWARRVVVLPIGERWLLVAVTIALFDPRVTLTTLLVLGGLATAYTTTGRVLRTAPR